MALFDEQSVLSSKSSKKSGRKDKKGDKHGRHKEKKSKKVEKQKQKNKEKPKKPSKKRPVEDKHKERKEKDVSENRRADKEIEKKKEKNKRQETRKKRNGKVEQKRRDRSDSTENKDLRTDEKPTVEKKRQRNIKGKTAGKKVDIEHSKEEPLNLDSEKNENEDEAVVEVDSNAEEEQKDDNKSDDVSVMSRATRLKMENVFVQYVFLVFAAHCGGCTVLIAITFISSIRDSILEGDVILTAFVSALLLFTSPLILFLYNKPHFRKSPPFNYVVFGLYVIPQAVAFAIYSQNMDTFVFLIFFGSATSLSLILIILGATTVRMTSRKVRYSLATLVAAVIVFGVTIIVVMAIDPRQQDIQLSAWRTEVLLVLGFSLSVFFGLLLTLGGFFKVCQMIRSKEYDIEYNDYLYPVSLYYCTIIMLGPMRFHQVLTAYREESDSEDDEPNVKPVSKTSADKDKEEEEVRKTDSKEVTSMDSKLHKTISSEVTTS